MKTNWKCAAGLLIGALFASGAWAQPNLATSTVPNVIVSPRGRIVYQVTIHNPGGFPIPGVVVTLAWPPAAFGMTCWCAGQVAPVAAATDGAGIASFSIAGGGCIDPAVAGTAVAVSVGGVPFTAVGQVSPDWVNGVGNPIPDCRVGLADAVAFTFPIDTGTYTFCADINSDGVVGLADAVLITPALAGAVSC